ncbi:NAD(P)-dependent oxidoreductase, partial [Haloferax profundi]|uniref:NAD(P)-dependent oxidoreductase n=1 Tax=Haloferax profundi TaxID=1544718 RepID=UPI000A64D907
MKRAIVDRDITPTDELLDGIPDSWDVSVGIDSDPKAVEDEISDANVAFVTSRVPLSRSIIERAEELEIIAKLGTGVDSIDRTAAAERDIPVTHTPGYNALSVAEHTVCLMLATLHRLTEARSLINAGDWRDEFTLATQLTGSTVGIVGFGD